MYDETADSYARMMDGEIALPVYAETLERLQGLIAKLPGVLIDTACGSGHMLSMYRDRFEPQRKIVGVDLSPRMVSIARDRLGPGARLLVGDMRDLCEIESCTAAALLNWYAVHHLSDEGVYQAMADWYRVLTPGGVLMVAAWQGAGQIDYGEASDIVAFRYSANQLSELAESAGFAVSKCRVVPVEDFPMDAVHLECVKNI